MNDTDAFQAIKAAGAQGFTTDELVETLGGRRIDVLEACQRLRERNLVRRQRRGNWIAWVAFPDLPVIDPLQGERSGNATEPFI